MKYKRLSLLLCCTLLSNTVVFAKGTDEKVEITTNKADVYLNGNKIAVNDITVDNSTYLPLRQLSEAMGLEVDYNAKTNEIKLTSGGEQKFEIENTSERVATKNVKVDMNSVDVFVDGVRIDAPNILYGGTTFLPLRKISDALGANLDYDSENDIIYLSTIENETTGTQNNRGATLKPMLTLEDITYPREPKTVEDFKKVMLYMANYNLTRLELTYNNSSFTNSFSKTDAIFTILEAANISSSEYVDLYSWLFATDFYVRTYTEGSSTKMVILIRDDIVNVDDAISKQQIFEERALELNDDLKQNGLITEGMSDKEIAKILYRTVTTSIEYDEDTYNYYETNFDIDTPDSFTGYGAAIDNIAVCQGYVAFYNYLLKLNGIDCYGQSGRTTDDVSHIWTVAMLDDEKCYIDVTYGDPVPDEIGYTDYDYFCISKEDLMKTRSWTE